VHDWKVFKLIGFLFLPIYFNLFFENCKNYNLLSTIRGFHNSKSYVTKTLYKNSNLKRYIGFENKV